MKKYAVSTRSESKKNSDTYHFDNREFPFRNAVLFVINGIEKSSARSTKIFFFFFIRNSFVAWSHRLSTLSPNDSIISYDLQPRGQSRPTISTGTRFLTLPIPIQTTVCITPTFNLMRMSDWHHAYAMYAELVRAHNNRERVRDRTNICRSCRESSNFGSRARIYPTCPTSIGVIVVFSLFTQSFSYAK